MTTDIIVLEPHDGMVLTNAPVGVELTNEYIYTTQVYLGIYDSVDNWREIPIEDVPPERGEDNEIELEP